MYQRWEQERGVGTTMSPETGDVGVEGWERCDKLLNTYSNKCPKGRSNHMLGSCAIAKTTLNGLGRGQIPSPISAK